MAYTTDQLKTAYTNANLGKGPDAATLLTLDAFATQSQTGGISDAVALSKTYALVNGTTAVAISTYQFFTGKAPSAAGLDFLVDSTTNTSDLNDAAYAKFNQENRFVNFAINLATGSGQGAAAFSAAYKDVSITQAVASAYDKIIGNSAAAAAGVDVAAAVAYLSRAENVNYLSTFIKANTGLTSATDVDLAVKAAIIGQILSIATTTGLGGYAASTAKMIADLGDDGVLTVDSAAGNDIFANYPSAGSSVVTLTNGTDIKSGNLFESNLVYTPDGGDRINALQNEDVLTGQGVNPTLNVVLGNSNDNGANNVTPVLNNIQTVKAQFTGNTNTLDLRSANNIQTLEVSRITANAGSATFQNISQPAANLSVANTTSVLQNVTFNYVTGVLDGSRATADADAGKLNLTNATLNTLTIGNTGNTEGFEALALTSTGVNNVKTLQATDLETLTVSGTGSLAIVNTTETNEATTVATGGLAIGDGIGIRAVDLSAFKGTTSIDITSAIGLRNDPLNSGASFYGNVKGGEGADTFWVRSSIAGETTKADVINGGDGVDTIRFYGGSISEKAKISNVEALEIRNNGGANQVADLDAFDAALTSVLLRDESAGASTFKLDSISKTLAESGKIVLQHGITGTSGQTVTLNLKDGSGASDTVAISVTNGLNTDTTFNYTLEIDGDNKADGTQTGIAVENVTIADNDTETNIVTLTKAAEHTGTIKLTGGTADLDFTVNSTLVAKTIDAEAQLSNLRLTVGAADQAIKLGAGNDILTFNGLDTLTGADVLTDAGGVDTVRAAFSKDVTGTPSLAGIEKFHIVATENTTIDLSKAGTITELAILSDKAVDGSGDLSPLTAEPFGIVAGVDKTDIITLKNTALSTLNFFGDNDTDDVTPANQSLVQTFNGVTLENNSVETLAVNINSSLDPDLGATSYALGKLTAHGVKTATIAVGNEVTGGAATTVDNVFAKNLESLKVTATGTVNLGTIVGSATNNSLKVLDASNVVGGFTANTIALGDNAVVNLSTTGANTFSGLGSSGKGVTINGGAKIDTITGTAQSDTINTGAGNDVVAADRGDNVLSLGAGDDTASAKDGNDTYSVGTGWDKVSDNVGTGLDGSKATNAVTTSGGLVQVQIDVVGDGLGGGDIDQYLAVGEGADLSLSWTGNVLNSGSATLNGSLAQVVSAGTTIAGSANSDFVVATSAAATFTFNGGNGADVFLGQTAGTAYTFNGGAGNDGFVGNTGVDDVTGGDGADKIVLSQNGSVDAAADIVHIADGESTAAAYDQVVGFGAIAGANADTLDLASTVIAANTAGTNGVNFGTGATTVASHAIVNGVVTFDNVDVYAGAETVGTGAGQLSLGNVLSYLSTALNGTGATVAFAWDRTGDGVTADDSTFIFQDGAVDTVVQLVGLTGVVALGTAAGANTILIA
ncbi:hypothetical protein [uncultured Caulobacter sp.]|uniref:beta strand repeat-containing protein n=1 Tax=uncultured Caulobacter sp. TaxID=158749 RepID=UPI002631F219|nr:hypothetical protein [uncultured Caulobacter sp.]